MPKKIQPSPTQLFNTMKGNLSSLIQQRNTGQTTLLEFYKEILVN